MGRKLEMKNVHLPVLDSKNFHVFDFELITFEGKISIILQSSCFVQTKVTLKVLFLTKKIWEADTLTEVWPKTSQQDSLVLLIMGRTWIRQYCVTES